MNTHVTKLKRTTKPHWKQLPSQAVQDVVLRMGKADDAFFRYCKESKAGKRSPRKVGLPYIKPRHKYNAVTFTQAGYKLEGNRIKIGCIDTWSTFHKHREIQGNPIKTVTIKRDACGDYWVCFSCDNVDISDPMPKTGQSVGIDFGLKTYLTLSDGTKIEGPQYFKRGYNKLRSFSKSLGRKAFKSNGWFKALRTLCSNIGRSPGNVLIGTGNSRHVFAGNMISFALKP